MLSSGYRETTSCDIELDGIKKFIDLDLPIIGK